MITICTMKLMKGGPKPAHGLRLNQEKKMQVNEEELDMFDCILFLVFLALLLPAATF